MTTSDLTLPSPEENLACDEALLDLAEEGESGEVLRFWEPEHCFVVVGYANHVAAEVNVAFCQRENLPILRRCTGGGTVLQGSGCLNYTLVLRIEQGGPTHSIPGTNDFVMERHREVLAALTHAPVEKQGHTDLTLRGLKFSGNAQRRKKSFLLFHGSFLLHLDLDVVSQALRMPSKQPAYRANRPHAGFLMNLEISAEQLKAALRQAWNATERTIHIPQDRIKQLLQDKYARLEWNLKF